MFAHTKVDCCNMIETEKMYKTDLVRPRLKTSYDKTLHQKVLSPFLIMPRHICENTEQNTPVYDIRSIKKLEETLCVENCTHKNKLSAFPHSIPI